MKPTLRCGLAAFVAAGLFSGCATTVVPTNEAAHVPPERMLAKSIAVQKPGHGHLIVKRDAGMVGAACYLGLLINGEAAANLDPGEKAEFWLPPGDHLLSIRYVGTGLCTIGRDLIETQTTITPDRARVFRLSVTENMQVMIQPTAF